MNGNLKMNKWTSIDIQYLKENYSSKTVMEIAGDLHRTIGSINFRVSILGLKKSKSYVRYKDPGYSSYKSLFNRLLQGARDRNYEVLLTLDDFKKIVSDNCIYCGAEPQEFNAYLKNDKTLVRKGIKQETIDRSWIKVNGIDRFDNNKGYTLSNSVACCSQCNTAKLDYSHNEFLEWIDRVWRFNFWKN